MPKVWSDGEPCARCLVIRRLGRYCVVAAWTLIFMICAVPLSAQVQHAPTMDDPTDSALTQAAPRDA